MNPQLYLRKKLKSNLLRNAFKFYVRLSPFIQLILFYLLINEINETFVFLFLNELFYAVFFYLMKKNSSYYFNTIKLQNFFLKFLMPAYILFASLFYSFFSKEKSYMILIFILIFLPRLTTLSTKVYFYNLEKLKLITINEIFQIVVLTIFCIIFSSKFFLVLSLSFLLREIIYYFAYKKFFE